MSRKRGLTTVPVSVSNIKAQVEALLRATSMVQNNEDVLSLSFTMTGKEKDTDTVFVSFYVADSNEEKEVWTED